LRPAHSRGHPNRDPIPEGFSHFVTSTTAPVASGWSDFAGWGFHPLESAALSRRTLGADMPVTLLISFRKAVLQIGADNSGTSIAHGSGPNHKEHLSRPALSTHPQVSAKYAIARVSTFALFTISVHLVNSSGEWLTPPIEGAKIRPAGT
jgi:hypothetical protein